MILRQNLFKNKKHTVSLRILMMLNFSKKILLVFTLIALFFHLTSFIFVLSSYKQAEVKPVTNILIQPNLTATHTFLGNSLFQAHSQEVDYRLYIATSFSTKSLESNLNQSLSRYLNSREKQKRLIAQEINKIKEVKQDTNQNHLFQLEKERLSQIYLIKERQKQREGKIDCDIDRCIAITFDDGPHPVNTNRLLDYLRERNVLATFYMVGALIYSHPETAKNVFIQGHEIGNHTWNHPNLTRISLEQAKQEVNSTSNIIKHITGQNPTNLRPPYGAINQTLLQELDLPVVNWSVDTLDWRDRDPELVAKRAVAGARNGSIILMHDLHSTSVDAVPLILDTLLAQGYKFVTVSHILGYEDNPEDLPLGKIYTNG